MILGEVLRHEMAFSEGSSKRKKSGTKPSISIKYRLSFFLLLTLG
jgi:hypothetical protein